MDSFVQAQLAETPFACSALTPIGGGTANFTYRGTLLRPPPGDADAHVFVKHGEPYVATNQAFKLSLQRCAFEDAILRAAAAGLVPAATVPRFSVRTPRPLLFHEPSTTQVHELLPGAVNLKSYCLKHYGAVPSPPHLVPQCEELGRALGGWLRSFHRWAASPDQAELRAKIAQNTDGQSLKLFVNFTWLVDAVGKFPSILADAKETFEAVRQAVLDEVKDGKEVQVIHGDFWTGNALLPDKPIQDDSQDRTDMFIVDWELTCLGHPSMDVGQMAAELYQLYLFKKMHAGLWLVRGLLNGYGPVDDSFAFRIAIQVGTHIISFGWSVSGWGTEAQVEQAVLEAKEIIARAWKRDRAWFEKHPLGCLFRKEVQAKET